MNGYQVSGTLFSCLKKILNFFFGIYSQTGQHFEILLLILALPKFVFLQWDLFTNWSAFGVCATISFDQFVNRSHWRNSNFCKMRKKGSAHLLAIHCFSLSMYCNIKESIFQFFIVFSPEKSVLVKIQYRIERIEKRFL